MSIAAGIDGDTVVYSCVTHGYDAVAPAPVSRCRFILFHDGTVTVPAGWQGVALQVPGIHGVHLNRYAKMLPHRLPFEAERSLYIDGNVTLRGDPGHEIARVLNAHDFGAYAHPARRCAYDELRELLRLGFAHPAAAWRHRRFFDSIGLPRGAGLMEAGILFRRHKEERVKLLDETWWQFWQHGLMRDQPLLQAASHASGVAPMDLGRNPVRDERSPLFSLAAHATRRTRQARLPNRLLSELLLYRLWAQ